MPDDPKLPQGEAHIFHIFMGGAHPEIARGMKVDIVGFLAMNTLQDGRSGPAFAPTEKFLVHVAGCPSCHEMMKEFFVRLPQLFEEALFAFAQKRAAGKN